MLVQKQVKFPTPPPLCAKLCVITYDPELLLEERVFEYSVVIVRQSWICLFPITQFSFSYASSPLRGSPWTPRGQKSQYHVFKKLLKIDMGWLAGRFWSFQVNGTTVHLASFV